MALPDEPLGQPERAQKAREDEQGHQDGPGHDRIQLLLNGFGRAGLAGGPVEHVAELAAVH
jgi:hypothetical protein